MSIRIEDYQSSVEALYALQNQHRTTSETATANSDSDSYISAASDEGMPQFCDTYNNILAEFAAKRATSMNASESSSSNSSTSDNQQSEAVSGAGGQGEDAEEKEEDSVETRIINYNGITYIETTRIEDGVKTVTRNVLERNMNPSESDSSSGSASAGASAIAGL